MLSIDPSSPFTQGALLGDRIRLADHFLDPGVFIRSMASRGSLGGLSEATLQAALLMDASGKDDVLLETVGVGQAEVDIIDHADTVVLVLMPGSGDSIQALKAGVMEIPDVIVVNKSDHPLTDTMVREIRGVLSLGPQEGWRVPIVKTEASRAEGIEELAEKIQRAPRVHRGAGHAGRAPPAQPDERGAGPGRRAAAPAPRGPGARRRVRAGAARRGGGAAARPGQRRGGAARARGESLTRSPGRLASMSARKYRLEPEEPVPEGDRARRLGRIDHALDELRGETDCTRGGRAQARKDMKKLRALLRLVRGELGDEVYRSESAAFRDAGRELAGLRDADVMLATLESLGLPPEDVGPLRQGLEAHKFRTAAGGRAQAAEARHRDAHRRTRPRGRLAARDRRLRGLRGRATAHLPPGPARLRTARKDPTAENLHEWRKRVKDLWYHLALLEEAGRR